MESEFCILAVNGLQRVIYQSQQISSDSLEKGQKIRCFLQVNDAGQILICKITTREDNWPPNIQNIKLVQNFIHYNNETQWGVITHIILCFHLTRLFLFILLTSEPNGFFLTVIFTERKLLHNVKMREMVLFNPLRV